MLWDEQKKQRDHLEPNTPQGTTDFETWLKQHDLTCFSYDTNGVLHTDFEVMDELHAKYLDTTAIKEISDRAQNIKNKQQQINNKKRRQVQQAQEQLEVLKTKDKHQYEYSL